LAHSIQLFTSNLIFRPPQSFYFRSSQRFDSPYLILTLPLFFTSFLILLPYDFHPNLPRTMVDQAILDTTFDNMSRNLDYIVQTLKEKSIEREKKKIIEKPVEKSSRHPNRQRYIDEFNQYPKQFPWPREMTTPECLVDAGFRWKYPIQAAGCNHPVICKHCHHFIDWSTVSERANHDPLGYHLFSSPSCPKAVQILENKEKAKLEHARQLKLEQARKAEQERIEYARQEAKKTKQEQARIAQLQLERARQLELEQAKKAEQERIAKPLKAKQKAFAEINQMQAAFRFRHSHLCKRCPEMFSSNTKLHQHIQACHTKKPVEKSPASPSMIEKTPQISSPPAPAPAPTHPIENTPLSPAKLASPSPKTPPPSPTSARKSESTAKSPSKSPRTYLPPHKRAHMTIDQLFKKFGSTWKACSVYIQPIRKLDPKAPEWLPANASKSGQSQAIKINCASSTSSARSATSASNSASTGHSLLPRKPAIHHRSYWPPSSPSPRRTSSPPPWSSRKSLENTWNGGIIEALLHTLLRLLGGENGHGYYGLRMV
ncbi:MAG: hypothetical protein Q9223_002177, partial [Gallowayella weberi]